MNIWQFLNRPMFGTTVIPKDASVDAEAFSEEEYPVSCPDCAYLLRGLSDGRCPECGRPFERGNLLVRQYVRQWSDGAWSRPGGRSWKRTTLVLGMIAGLLGVGILHVLVWGKDTWGSPLMTTRYDRDLAVALAWAAALLLGTAMMAFLLKIGVSVATCPRGAWRRRRAVIRAMRTAGEKDPGEMS